MTKLPQVLQPQVLRKIVTKNGNIALVVNNDMSIVKKDDVFHFYPNVTHGTLCEDQDASEFLEAWYDHLLKKEQEENMEKEKLRLQEEERILKLKEEIANCNSPRELAEYFNMTIVETASHWNELHNGRSKIAIKIENETEYEIMQLASEIHNIDGDWGEVRRRDGEHHNTFSQIYDLETYRQNCQQYFSDKFFYKSKETEEELYLERIKECDNMEDVAEISLNYNKIEDGYYSEDSLIVSDEDLDNFYGYCYDVYTYSFAFNFYWGDKFNN